MSYRKTPEINANFQIARKVRLNEIEFLIDFFSNILKILIIRYRIEQATYLNNQLDSMNFKAKYRQLTRVRFDRMES